MSYAYYPGCSASTMAKECDLSARAVLDAFGIDLQEIPDWNCCGATALASASGLASIVVPLRNLALAEEMGMDVAVVCNSCFVTLRRAAEAFHADADVAERCSEALSEIGREFRGRTRVRHVLDILVDDVGLDGIAKAVVRPLKGLRAAPYYGCQLTRPSHESFHAEAPVEMDRVLEALGLEVPRYDGKTRCCGAALVTTKEDKALRLLKELLDEAEKRECDVIATICPMCQFNLEAYQDKVNARFGTRYRIPVMFLTELLGVAMGIEPSKLGIGRHFVPTSHVLAAREGVV